MPYMKRLAVYDLTRNRQNRIGVIVNSLDSPFVTHALEGIREAASRNGYDIFIADSPKSIDKEIANLRLLPAEVAVAFLDRPGRAYNRGVVAVDNAMCGYLAAEHLLQQGCRQPVMAASRREDTACALRTAGFHSALRKYGMGRQGQCLLTGDIDTEAGAAALIWRLLRMIPRPDGLFITGDRAAAMCIHALDDAGLLVPRDMAIVGFHNEPIGRLMSPSLTTIGYPGQAIGRIAASRLLGGLSGRVAAGTRTTVMPPFLIMRNSSLKGSFFCKNSID